MKSKPGCLIAVLKFASIAGDSLTSCPENLPGFRAFCWIGLPVLLVRIPLAPSRSVAGLYYGYDSHRKIRFLTQAQLAKLAGLPGAFFVDPGDNSMGSVGATGEFPSLHLTLSWTGMDTLLAGFTGWQLAATQPDHSVRSAGWSGPGGQRSHLPGISAG